jgi:hypothetical protein
MDTKDKIPSWPTHMVKLTDSVQAYTQTKGTLGLVKQCRTDGW